MRAGAIGCRGRAGSSLPWYSFSPGCAELGRSWRCYRSRVSSQKSEKHVMTPRLAPFSWPVRWTDFNGARRWLRHGFDLYDLPEIPIQFCLRTLVFVAFVRVQLFPA